MFNKNILALHTLSRRAFFAPEDAADALGIGLLSARVFCSRCVQRGLMVKLKNNLYATSQKWDVITRDELFAVSNIIQVPSYVSFMTALDYYELTTQVTRGMIENACLKRSIEYSVRGIAFRYFKLKKKYYFDFVRKSGLFIATKEKAFLDAVYLYSFGKYRLDFGSLDLKKINKTRLLKLLKIYPSKTKKIVRSLCRI
jgi:predicted transcriptional regulator of viral defense system